MIQWILLKDAPNPPKEGEIVLVWSTYGAIMAKKHMLAPEAWMPQPSGWVMYPGDKSLDHPPTHFARVQPPAWPV